MAPNKVGAQPSGQAAVGSTVEKKVQGGVAPVGSQQHAALQYANHQAFSKTSNLLNFTQKSQSNLNNQNSSASIPP